MVVAAKLPVLNPKEFELWKMREQYFLMTDYALWEVIVNGDSPPPKRTVDSVEQTYPPTTAEEKLPRKNELKTRGTLLMALPNEHQLKFNTYKCAKTMMEAIEKRFGGNKESKKTQKTLLKQHYENFNGSSSEGFDQTYDRLQKLISQLEILVTLVEEKMSMWKGNLPSGTGRREVMAKFLEWNSRQATWSGGQDVGVVAKGLAWGSRVEFLMKGDGCFWTANISLGKMVAIYKPIQLNDEYLQQIDVDDLEEMDLKWQMAMLTMRARRFLNKTRRKINANGFETIGFNKSKVECYNCHKKGHFTNECRAPRKNRNREPVRRNVTVETTETKALVAQDGLGSSSSDSEVSTCSKACLKSYETLKEHYDNLTKDFNKSQLNVGAYKAGLESVEARLDVYKKNEVVFEEDIKILKLDIKLRDNALTELRKKFEKAEKERDDLKLTLEKFGNSSKNLSKLYKTSGGYHVVPPPYTGNFMPPKSDLVLADEEEYISDSEDEDENETEFKSKQTKPSFAKIEFVKSNEHVKTPRESVKKVENKKQAKYPRKNSQSLRGNQINWNNLMTRKLGSNFEFKNKACYECGSFNHLIKDCDFYEKKMVEKNVWNNARRVNHQNSQRMTHPHPKGNFVPKAVLMKFGIKTLNTVGKNFSKAEVSVNTARPINTTYPRPTVNSERTASNIFNRAHSHGNVTTAGLIAAVSNNKGNEANALELQEKGIIDNGCSRHMTGNKSYLSDYEEIDGGFVTFRGDPKGGRITGKGKISTDTECVVLSPDFKLLDENHVLLRVPRKDNMYNVDLKNIVPSGGLTCLFAKATLDESNLWHRRLGHINFKTLNKLVRGNLVRGLPSKIFENNHTCVACQKGKQHKASCKTKTVSSISQPLQMLHMDLFGPTFVKSLMKKVYCLVVTDDYSRFSWVFFLATKDETSKILKTFITGIENLIDLKVKVIRCDNGTKFKNKVMNQFCEIKGIKREFSVVRNPHQNGVAERKNRTLIKVSLMERMMKGSLYDLPIAKHTGDQTNGNAGTKENIDTGQNGKKIVPDQEYILLPLLTSDPSLFKSSKDSLDVGFKPSREEEKIDSEHVENKDSEVPNTEEPRVNQEQDANVNSTNNINTVCPTVNAADIENNIVDENIVYGCIDDPNMPNLEEIVYSDDDEEVGAEADMNNLAITDELLQFKLQKVWTLVDLPYGKRAIGTKWVYRNKKDDRVARIQAIRLILAYASFMNFIVYQIDVKSAFLYGTIEEEVYVCQPLGFKDPEFPIKVYKADKALYGLHQAPRACYENVSTYLLENRFRRGTIDKTLFIKKDKDDIMLVQVYVDDIIFGSTKKSLCTEFEQMMHKRFQISSMGELTFFLGLQVKQKDDGIFISQDKYVADILKKFDFATLKTTSTPIETNKALLKDEEAADVDVHLYRSMIGSSMYLTDSRPDIMFAVCACARDSPFDLEAFSDSDYAGVSLDRKSTTGGCQFLRRMLISWQCKKQTIVANSTTEAEYVAATNCCRQVLWIQNQLFDYGYNFMNTEIFIDNESIICIVKNQVFHSKTKHIEIRHHFIRDSYEKRLIQVIKIHTDHNVADLLTKAFDVSKFQYLIANETVIKEWEDIMERAATTASSLEAEQDNGNINRTQSMTTLNESFPQGTDSGSGPRVNTLRSGEDNMKLKELMEFCTKLSVRALDL
ncbi:putative ribonuclease H-like domain-containing protein [Tanacetum coccineum]